MPPSPEAQQVEVALASQPLDLVVDCGQVIFDSRESTVELVLREGLRLRRLLRLARLLGAPPLESTDYGYRSCFALLATEVHAHGKGRHPVQLWDARRTVVDCGVHAATVQPRLRGALALHGNLALGDEHVLLEGLRAWRLLLVGFGSPLRVLPVELLQVG